MIMKSVVLKLHQSMLPAFSRNLITLGSALDLITKTIRYPHKLPEPLHLAHKLMKKGVKEN